ncbi:RagB/SusD family nutrient uptake outer membrane protein [Sinomicrobium weinanense]|uniref:RagB/SusD family nutrient uptake outer membrane protein n=1 Tax=Sinomicrobium weinanense TaxID=2842200 RepID=A0A926JUL2_9FLAO|nr:RagB/SusD family nutrient uptake outer membrane protein [Sinomicrobium weinanense]MBC9797750.1 RagB/SusD family nutrient uptake outer membrane protein [Sinomicrobium weinanense]MBU3125985.1 RagB/SusD family nutrient uptake outer membrane protein [Sinomicrobium weinanense]
MKTILNKKNALRVMIPVLMLFAMTGCEKDLNEEVYSDFTGDNFFTDVNSAELGLMGIYDVLGSEDLYGRGYLLYFHSGTDLERYWRQNRGLDDDLLANYQIQENNGWIGQVWTAFYDGINRANLVIDRVTVLRDKQAEITDPSSKETADLNAYNNILGDAYFLRAFMYFQLVKNWGDVPLRLSSEISFNELQSRRAPKEEVYQQIESDILQAIEYLPPASAVATPGRINRGAARGILARIYLNWAGYPVQDKSKFEKAAEQAWAVVSSGEHQLNSVIEPVGLGGEFDQPFPRVFRNLAEKVYDLRSSMWEIHFSFQGSTRGDASTVGVWHGVHQADNSSYGRGAPRRYPLPTFFDSYEEKDSLRRDWTIAQFEINKNDEFVPLERKQLKWGVGKFRRYLIGSISPDKNYDIMNWPVIRYADVLLMLAESVNETVMNGGTLPPGVTVGNAYEAINRVRRNARAQDPNVTDPETDLSGGAGEQFRQQIRNERKWELAFENLRKPDLVRWGILVETVKQTGAKMVAQGFDKETDYFPAHNIQDKHVLLPIPFSAEISQNPKILETDPTNNGYR